MKLGLLRAGGIGDAEAQRLLARSFVSGGGHVSSSRLGVVALLGTTLSMNPVEANPAWG